MKIHDVEQGTEAWFNLRLGVPSASRFKDLLTTKGNPSASADKYLNDLLSERLSGKRFETFKSHWMQRGNDLEPEAADVFSFQQDMQCREIGFVTNDDQSVGCSPDRIVGEGMTTGLEIKCPSPAVHTAYLREYAKSGAMPPEYYAQVQGTMWLMDFKDYYFMSYHPDLPNLIMKVERDEEYIAALSAAIEKLLENLKTNYELIGNIYAV